MRSEHPDDLLAAYTLDALTTEEWERVQAHLAGCAECRRWVAQHDPVAQLLPLSLSPGPEPSVELRDRILRAAERTEQVRVTAKVTPIRSGPSRLVRVGGWLAAAL